MRSDDGLFEGLGGQRMPSEPRTFASWGGDVHVRGVFTKNDELQPFYQGRYVDSMNVLWEGQVTLAGETLRIPSQLTHNVGLSYLARLGNTELFASMEVQNVSDALVFDQFALPRPGRAFYGKVGGRI